MIIFEEKKFKIFLRVDHHDQYNANYKMLHFVFMSVAVRRSKMLITFIVKRKKNVLFRRHGGRKVFYCQQQAMKQRKCSMPPSLRLGQY